LFEAALTAIGMLIAGLCTVVWYGLQNMIWGRHLVENRFAIDCP
jgi:hypothetical protein